MMEDKMKTVHSDKVRLGISFEERHRKLILPKRSFSPSELLVSSLLRACEVKMGIRQSEKVIKDSQLLAESNNKRMVFIGDIANFYWDGLRAITQFINLTAVGYEDGGVVTHIKPAIGNLVAEVWEENLNSFDFGNLSGKILLGTTLMFSADVLNINGDIYLYRTKVLDFGLRLFNEDGTVDTLARFGSEFNCYGLEHFTIQRGEVVKNEYRNTCLDDYFWKYGESGDGAVLYSCAEYIVGAYDIEGTALRDVAVGIARVVEADS